jgi:error-prone DNA polymerase
VGGFVITEGRLDELVPIENATMEDRTVICWDKDDIDALGILKVDVLALGMLTCIRKAFDTSADASSRGAALHAGLAAAGGSGGL